MPHAAPKYTNLHIIHHHTPLNTVQNSHRCYQLRPFLNRCCICYALESSLTICYTIYNRDTPRYLEIIPQNIPPHQPPPLQPSHHTPPHPLEHRAEFSLMLPVTNRYYFKYPRESSFTIRYTISDRDTPRYLEIIPPNIPPTTNLHHYNLHIIHHHPLEHRAEFSLTLPVTNRYDLKYPRESSFTISIMIFDRDTPRSHQIISRNTPPSPTHQPPL